MAEIAVLVPVLGRPRNAQPLADSLNASTDQAHLVFLCSPGDAAEIDACRATGETTVTVDFEPGRADWARKLETGRRLTVEPFMLLGADDLRFHQGWVEAVLETFERTGAGLVGTNDLANPLVRRGRHSTHPVVSRVYADRFGTVDDPKLMVPQAYSHCWVDNELVQTAMARGMWAFARDAHVEHLHPIWRTAEDDATYRRGQERYREDQRLFMERRKMWQDVRAPGT